MLELQLAARRGAFELAFECSISGLWAVIFGPSGAGKTTLLRLIAGLETPDTARIALHGRYLTDTAIGLKLRPGPAPQQRRVGLAAQQPSLFPNLNVSANVAYGLQSLDASKRAERVSQALKLVAATHLAERRPGTLSGGEAQRVSLARAIAPLPQLLLLDEPLSALGAVARDAVLSRLQPWLAERKIQTLLVTHDAADALATDAEVLLLEDGKLIAQGPAREVLAAERQRLLARLQGTG